MYLSIHLCAQGLCASNPDARWSSEKALEVLEGMWKRVEDSKQFIVQLRNADPRTALRLVMSNAGGLEELKQEQEAHCKTKGDLQATKGDLQQTKGELQATKQGWEQTKGEVQALSTRIQQLERELAISSLTPSAPVPQVQQEAQRNEVM